MADDMALLRAYAESRSEEAFAALVSRHIHLVYSVALREVHNTHLAEEVTQAVFIILAKRAGLLSPRTVLPGWLWRTTRNTSANALRNQRRRQVREQEAYMQAKLNETESAAWIQIEPLLETAIAELGERDHDAVVLRFIESRSFKDVGAAIGTSEAGAKMQVNRALEKLRRFFTKNGLTCSVAAIAAAISANSVQAAPIGLATSVTAVIIKGTTATTTLTLIETILKLMAWTKFKTTIVIGVLAILAAGTATVTFQRTKGKAETSPFTFAGYATPEASVQSMLWVTSKGDLEKLPAGITTQEMERFKGKMEGKTEDEIRRGLIAWANAMADYKITQKEVISDDEAHLHIHATPSAEALHSGKVTIKMVKIGNEWKWAGDVN